ncbi:Hpt domain-containing protein [Ponticoccus sp. SC6-38]|nr:Hpt domain-containing protein [Ponticoccus sp. SC6-38]MBM1294153.1 Hpt domain-containing protein [Ponticoccus sp. SC6-11]
MTEQPLIDLEKLVQFGPLLQSGLIDHFKADLSDEISAIRAALASSQFEAVSSIAHRAVGLCQVVGADSLITRMRLIEHASLESNIEEIRLHTRELDDLLERTVSAMKTCTGESRTSGQE